MRKLFTSVVAVLTLCLSLFGATTQTIDRPVVISNTLGVVSTVTVGNNLTVTGSTATVNTKFINVSNDIQVLNLYATNTTGKDATFSNSVRSTDLYATNITARDVTSTNSVRTTELYTTNVTSKDVTSTNSVRTKYLYTTNAEVSTIVATNVVAKDLTVGDTNVMDLINSLASSSYTNVFPTNQTVLTNTTYKILTTDNYRDIVTTISSIPKHFADGVVVTVTFQTGTYGPSNILNFAGFNGNGILVIRPEDINPGSPVFTNFGTRRSQAVTLTNTVKKASYVADITHRPEHNFFIFNDCSLAEIVIRNFKIDMNVQDTSPSTFTAVRPIVINDCDATFHIENCIFLAGSTGNGNICVAGDKQSQIWLTHNIFNRFDSTVGSVGTTYLYGNIFSNTVPTIGGDIVYAWNNNTDYSGTVILGSSYNFASIEYMAVTNLVLTLATTNTVNFGYAATNF